MVSHIRWSILCCWYSKNQERTLGISIIFVLNSTEGTGKNKHLIRLSLTWLKHVQFGLKFNLACSGDGVWRSQFDMFDAETEIFQANKTNSMVLMKKFVYVYADPLSNGDAISPYLHTYLFCMYLTAFCMWAPSTRASYEKCSYFYTPVWITDVLCRGNVRPSVRLSVRVFRTFLQHALRYQFETWYIDSVGGTTCRVWVASQLGHFDLVYSQK